MEVVDGDGDADGGERGGTDGRERGGTEERAARARARENCRRGRRVCFFVFGFFVLGDDARGARRRSVVTRGAFVNGEDD